MTRNKSLPLVLAGPILRHCDKDNFTLWLVTSKPLQQTQLHLHWHVQNLEPQKASQNIKKKYELTDTNCHHVALGLAAHQYLIHLHEPDLLPEQVLIHYQLIDEQQGHVFSSINQLNYHDEIQPSFVIKPNLERILHGSCRNPHHHSGDALVAADAQFEQQHDPQERPALLMLSGDQVYVDDIAGPMIYAIGQVISLLGLQHETFVKAPITSSEAINYQADAIYQRHKQLLPHTEYQAKTSLWRWYINHPIFTSSLAENHLVSLGEVSALYLLIWSPELWDLIDIPKELPGLGVIQQRRWYNEWQHLLEFKAGLTQVRRLFAHIPTYMIFDDHDVTDDWNLTAKWEMAAYGHPFSKRIIGNALIGYTLFQGLGNQPQHFEHQIKPLLNALFHAPTSAKHDTLIEALLSFEQWHYTLNTSPKVVVLDTRTRRWRSESNLGKPSGLLDWEALMDLQHELIDQSQVIIVSPAPIFGVKVIEAIQRIATMMGGSLLVDAENWMAHPGSANTLLSIFLHKKTPQEFIILSGDVHYSFAYDIGIRFRHGGPNIYQICCSGIKNQFPEKLLPIFGKLNGWLYGYFSPLNLFTKRKRLTIRGRRPNGHRSKRLVNQSGLGLVELNADGSPAKIAVLHADSSETIFVEPRKKAQD
ncbi:alkaline phosphatase D family protein [Shewanella gelidii]|uniref:Metallophosphatase-binding domain protein n=1 Tax=Shewanella gelidii TaxID=1642821 RepID=A0A917JRM6_9GAMM|nr:alkaline phosphatase D family protein [Shewanella gelidii]MCL1097586.1 alkaline phosphatase family protein [Shewanella gelidii]GGI80413.1 metallophosphatase-binding domain protein [Shewanella gelidii]